MQIEDVSHKITVLPKELEAKKAEAESASSAKSDFLANMRYELRIHRNSIIGFLKIIIDGLSGEITESQKKYLKYQIKQELL